MLVAKMVGTETPEKSDKEKETEHDPHYEPVITLPLQDVKTLEEEENELFKMHAKLYRWASECDPPEWKERGTGDVKFLQHQETKKVRLLMRRDKTLKICANHFVEKYMNLVPNCGSERAWVWNVLADLSDDEPKAEMLAIRFYNAENAKKFKEMFEKCAEINSDLPPPKEPTKEEGEDEKKDQKEEELESTTKNLEGLKIEKKEVLEEETKADGEAAPGKDLTKKCTEVGQDDQPSPEK